MENTNKKIPPIRLLTIGDSGVGKTAILLRFTDDVFSRSYTTTIGIDFKIKNVVVDGVRYKLQIWDTAGQERYRTITANYFRGSLGIIVIYDVTRRDTFESVSRWMNDISKYANPESPVLLVGNKIDMLNNTNVSTKEGKELASKYDAHFFECSSKDGINIDEIFYHITREIVKKHADELSDQPKYVKLSETQKDEQEHKENKENKKCC